MKTWKTTTEQEIKELVSIAENSMTTPGRKLWEFVRLHNPEKWELTPWGDEGNGFWVVAVTGNTCLYYNDIEDGFNISAFKKWGVIDEYFCDQQELQDVFNAFAESIS